MCDLVEYSLTLETARNRVMENKTKRISLGKLCLVLAISAVTTAGELVLAQMTHSITLLVLVHQNIYNCITVAVSCASTKLSVDPSLKNTFGWHRTDVVGSISSLVFLFSLCFATFVEALQTLAHTDHLDTFHHPDWILLLMAAHVGIWFFIFTIIGGYSHHQNAAVRMGERKSILKLPISTKQGNSSEPTVKEFLAQVKLNEVARDLAGVGFVLASCLMVKYSILRSEYTAYLDPALSLVYIISLIWSSVALVKDSCLILLQTIPGNVEVSLLMRVLLAKFPDILGIHEMHVWTYTPSNLVLTAHVKYRNSGVYREIFKDVDEFFMEHGFKQVTIQPEFLESDNPTPQEIAACSWACQGEECREKACCSSHADAPEVDQEPEVDQAPEALTEISDE